MHKWSRGYRSLMKKLKNDEQGFTLVELLAVLALFSVIVGLGGSLFWFGSDQYIAQTEAVGQNNDLSYALTEMSKELRVHAQENVTVNENGTTINIDGNLEYYIDGSKLMKSGSVLADSVNGMKAVKNTDNITITLTSNSQSRTGQDRTYETTIYFRGE